ncbi:MAG TPA: hypothetical protein VM684_07880, partial [Gaiellales bacterium]|nr:hypothetical protein [Gaiellales bacterium]
HGRGLPLAAPGALAVVLAFARRPRISLPLVLGCVGALALVVGALAWSFHITASAGGSAYGGEAHFGAGSSFTLKGFIDYVWQFYFPRLPGMAPKIGPDYGFDQVFILSFFGLFASLEVGYPGWVYDLLHTASLVGLVALIAALWVHRRGVIRRWDMLAVMAAMVVALLFVLHYVAYRDMLGQPGDPVLVGRYILPLVSVFALAIATVASALPRRVGLVFGALVLSAGLLLQLGGLGVTLVRFYA